VLGLGRVCLLLRVVLRLYRVRLLLGRIRGRALPTVELSQRHLRRATRRVWWLLRKRLSRCIRIHGLALRRKAMRTVMRLRMLSGQQMGEPLLIQRLRRPRFLGSTLALLERVEGWRTRGVLRSGSRMGRCLCCSRGRNWRSSLTQRHKVGTRAIRRSLRRRTFRDGALGCRSLGLGFRHLGARSKWPLGCWLRSQLLRRFRAALPRLLLLYLWRHRRVWRRAATLTIALVGFRGNLFELVIFALFDLSLVVVFDLQC
jgi:hypothetical protein